MFNLPLTCKLKFVESLSCSYGIDIDYMWFELLSLLVCMGFGGCVKSCGCKKLSVSHGNSVESFFKILILFILEGFLKFIVILDWLLLFKSVAQKGYQEPCVCVELGVGFALEWLYRSWPLCWGSSNAIMCSSILWATHFCRERNSILLPKGWISGLTTGELEEGENGGIVSILYRF